jgi:hypothetical protein
MSYLGTARKAKEDFRKSRGGQNEPVADPMDGRIIAVKICSHVLDACIWFSFDPDFEPDVDEPLAIFYSEEIPFLCQKTPEQLHDIHRWKLEFGPARGCGNESRCR